MNRLEPNKGIKVFDIKWETDTAGPSPNMNKRIELFLLGCEKAMQGNACKDCFNSVAWDKNIAEWSWDPIKLADHINNNCDPNNKYITIGGGEPTDQIEHLIPLCEKLKEYGFHIMMYTWRNMYDIANTHIFKSRLIKYLDIIVDGEFKKDECLYQQDLGDGMLSSIGSGNQIIWDIKAYREDIKTTNKDLIGFKMRNLIGLYIKPDTNDLVYITKK